MKITDNHKKAMDWLIANGYPLHVASGIGANFQQESTFNPNAVNKDSGAFGLAQWLGDRQTDLKKYAFNKNKPISDLTTQLEFMDRELKGNEKKALRSLLLTKTPEEAAQVFSSKFERAGKHETNDAKRQSFASNLMDFFISPASADETPYKGTVGTPSQEGLSDAEMEALMNQPAPEQTQEGLSDAEMEALMNQPAPEPKKQTAPSNGGAAKELPTNSQTQSALKGATQGLTFGFGDEINGAGYALRDAIFGDNNGLSLADNYSKYRDASRADFDKAQQDNPKTFIAGEIGGNIANPVSWIGSGAGVVKGLGYGAAQGAANAAGASDSVDSMPKDIAIGGGLGAVGSAVGSAINKGVGGIFTKTPDKEYLKRVALAESYGIPLTTAQKTGNKTAGWMTSALDNYPLTGGKQLEQKQLQREAWQQRVLADANPMKELKPEQQKVIDDAIKAAEKKAGRQLTDDEILNVEDGVDNNVVKLGDTQATPEVMGEFKASLSKKYDELTKNNKIVVDHEFKKNIQDIEKKYSKHLAPNQKAIVHSYIGELKRAPVGAEIDGETYQRTRSLLDKQRKSMRASDPFTSDILAELRSSLDNAMGRNLSGVDKQYWDLTNKSWRGLKLIEAAVDPETSNIKPHILLNKLTKDDPNGVIYGKGDQTLPMVAKVGKTFIPDKLPDSGTASRTLWNNVLTLGAGTGAGAAMFSDNNNTDPLLYGAAGLILAPKMASWVLRNGHLANGLVNTNKQLVGNVTPKHLINNTTRQLANQAIKAGVKKKEDK